MEDTYSDRDKSLDGEGQWSLADGRLDESLKDIQTTNVYLSGFNQAVAARSSCVSSAIYDI